ncbi:hypothetical protein ACT691_20875 [Vibrio metschnikovii]
MDMSRSLYATDIKPNRLSQASLQSARFTQRLARRQHWFSRLRWGCLYCQSFNYRHSHDCELSSELIAKYHAITGANAAAGVALAIEMLQQAGFQQGDILLIADDLSANEASAISSLVRGKPWQLSFARYRNRKVGHPLLCLMAHCSTINLANRSLLKPIFHWMKI